jgi:glycosyltransferase involved in cell wall biosynthesis
VDDACPEQTGDWVEQHCKDTRVTVIRHERNRGVGAATLSGYRAAVEDGADVIVKIDGDGQMNTDLIRLFTEPVLSGRADYAKGNRFFNLEDTRSMPAVCRF